ncbi:MAG: hypothetical protein FJW96_01730 [Actinobacteria bacterium]|nr:hypothetical protein [Actinomycetota bacterium]
MALPLEPRQLVGLVREARRPTPSARPVHVSGVLARELRSALVREGGGAVVREGTGDGASVLVRVLGGAPGDEDVRVLRQATRRLVPAVAVQTAPWSGDVPYVPATEVVPVPPGQGFPVEEIAAAIARVVDEEEGAALASVLPALAEAVRREQVRRATLQAAFSAGTSGAVQLPVLANRQTRLLGSLRRTAGVRADDASPQELARTIGPELALPLVAGLAARGLVRRLPRRGRLVRATVAAGVTLALGELASRRPRA